MEIEKSFSKLKVSSIFKILKIKKCKIDKNSIIYKGNSKIFYLVIIKKKKSYFKTINIKGLFSLADLNELKKHPSVLELRLKNELIIYNFFNSHHQSFNIWDSNVLNVFKSNFSIKIKNLIYIYKTKNFENVTFNELSAKKNITGHQQSKYFIFIEINSSFWIIFNIKNLKEIKIELKFKKNVITNIIINKDIIVFNTLKTYYLFFNNKLKSINFNKHGEFISDFKIFRRYIKIVVNNEDNCFIYNIHNHKKVLFNNYKTNKFSDFIEINNLIFIKTKIYYKIYDLNQKDIFENILKKSELITGFQFFQNNLILNININMVYCVNIHSFKINKIVKNDNKEVDMMKLIFKIRVFDKNFISYKFIKTVSNPFLNKLKDFDYKLFFKLENYWELNTKNSGLLLFLKNQPNGIIDNHYRSYLNNLNNYEIIDMHKFDTYLSIKFNNNEGFIYNLNREKKIKLNNKFKNWY